MSRSWSRILGCPEVGPKLTSHCAQSSQAGLLRLSRANHSRALDPAVGHCAFEWPSMRIASRASSCLKRSQQRIALQLTLKPDEHELRVRYRRTPPSAVDEREVTVHEL
jgi:hypothetical protein